MKMPKQKMRLWKNPRWATLNEIIIVVLILAALTAGAQIFVWMTEEDRQAKDSYVFARERIGQMRAEREYEYECERCGGTASTLETLLVHNCINTTEVDKNGDGVPELKNAFAKNWIGRKLGHYGTKNRYWDGNKWIIEVKELIHEQKAETWTPDWDAYKRTCEQHEKWRAEEKRAEEEAAIEREAQAMARAKQIIDELSEPNEPECKHESGFNSCLVYGCDCKPTCAICGEEIKSYDIGDPDAVLHYHEPEPEPKKYSFPSGFIPTWPDYIELEKDLVIDIPVDFGDIKTFGYRLIKGTKIYFK